MKALPPLSLLLLPHALERATVDFLVHEPACLGVPLDPAPVTGVVSLGAATHSTDPMTITFRGVSCHPPHLLSWHAAFAGTLLALPKFYVNFFYNFVFFVNFFV